MNSLRVLLVTPYDLAVPGGVNRHTLDLLNALTKRGVEARLIGPSSALVRGDDPRILSMGKIWTRAFNGARTRITLDLHVVLQLKRCLREFRPDVLHVQEPVAPLPCAAALWLAARSTRRVGTFHTYSETSRGYLWSWPWFKVVRSSLEVQVAVSEAAREFVGRYHSGPCVVIPHAVHLPPAAEMRPAHPPGNPVELLFVGRMDEPRKGFAVMIEALKRLQAEQPGKYRLTAVGPGANHWQSKVETLPVRLGGELTDQELGKAYAGADLLCLPSIGGESFGLVAVEALAHGLPVIASKIRGYEEWLKDTGTGALAEPGDPISLARAIQATVESESRHRDCALKARALAETFDWDFRVNDWLRIYRGDA